jgi:hypothetical protein
MWKKYWWLIPLFRVLVLIILLLAGREKPPTQEMINAEKAIAEAKQKEIQGMIGKWEIEMMNIKEIIQGQKYGRPKTD